MGAMKVWDGTQWVYTAPGGGEPPIANPVSPTLKFWRGDKTWQQLTLEDLQDAWPKRTVKVASTAGKAYPYVGLDIIDGYQLLAGDRVLMKTQTDMSQQGIWLASAGTWTRPADADTSMKIASAFVGVDRGVAQGGMVFRNYFKTTDILGTSLMPWHEASGGRQIVPALLATDSNTLYPTDSQYWMVTQVVNGWPVAGYLYGTRGVNVHFQRLQGGGKTLEREWSGSWGAWRQLSPGVQIDVITTVGASSWTKPEGAVMVQATVISGGGGGGAGRRGLNTSIRTGGGGGGGGAMVTRMFAAAELGATVAVNVGAGGTGAPGITVNDTNGANALAGGTSSFHEARAGGGQPGAGGQAGAGGGGGVGGVSEIPGGAAGGGSATGTGGVGASNSAPFASGGGGGGGITAANVASTGGTGGAPPSITTATTPGGAIGAAGSAGAVRTSDGVPGSGGGGGGASITGSAGVGGAGSAPGGGGGGGGASTNSVGTSGPGGDGAPGLVIVRTYF